ncbi:MAG: DNA polymerase III subunit delta [Bacteroidota bacterium]|nr:DNA polymerase III subunit delta [Bacteroidota bacterium]
MTADQILKDLKNKVYSPVYFLMGEEPYYIDKISDYIIDNVLDENDKEFNQTIVYGRDVDIPAIISIAKRFPMMSNYQVVVVKEAQNIDKIELLQSYIDNPLNSTLLVFCYKYKTIDGRKKFAKDLDKKAVLFDSKTPKDNQIPSVIVDFAKQRDYKINQEASYLLYEYLGSDLSKISNELDKLSLVLPPKSEINVKIIEEYIGISKDYTVFELQKALLKGDKYKSNLIVNYFAANPKDNPMVVIMSNLYSYFSKILTYHYLPDKSDNNVAAVLKIIPYYAKEYAMAARAFPVRKTEQIIGLLREYDVKSKGVDNESTSHGELLKELVYKILHF